jgi:hypothetical protein
MFGPGQWTFMKRFLIEQASGKIREIDNGKHRHNSFTSDSETIWTFGPDYVIAYVMLLVSLWLSSVGVDPSTLSEAETLRHLPDWFLLVLSIDDLKDAYRQCPVSARDLRHVSSHIGVGWPAAGGLGSCSATLTG